MTPNQTEAHTELQASPGKILDQIRVGFLLQFESVGFSNTYAVATVVPEYGSIVLVTSRPVEQDAAANANFEVTAYSYDGRSQAKISLRSIASPTGFWAPGSDIPKEFPKPIVIADRPGEFLLTDTGNERISIQNTYSPPDPYIRRDNVSWPYLKYGFAAAGPGEERGLFRITIVG